MSGQTLKVAVVGHTNTGKTSLMRTLMRDVDFGEVSDRPAVTREVEAAVLRAQGEAIIDLFDTPGLEDSIGLLEHLDAMRGESRIDRFDIIKQFLDGPEARGQFSQEAKALKQVLNSDVAVYVIDVRDRVLGKHRDELEILGRCARPVVPVLNFTAADDARAREWRGQLARVNMHAVVEFDTVVFNEQDERRLFEKMRTLLDAHSRTLDNLITERAEIRKALIQSSAALLAELLIDVAACTVLVPVGDKPRAEEKMADLKQKVREREQRCVEQLLALHCFRPGDVEETSLPIDDGAWGLDLFSPAAVRQFSTHAGSAALTGAMVGLTLDIMLAGLSLGTGALAGAAIGGLFGAARTHGKRMYDRARGMTELHCDDATLRLLAARETLLIIALLRRGHAAIDAIRVDVGVPDPDSQATPNQLLELLARARVHPGWSDIAPTPSPAGRGDPARQETLTRLTEFIRNSLLGDRE